MKGVYKMKRIASILLVGIILTMALVSCTGSNEDPVAPDGMKLASAEESAYYLYVPESWGLIDGYGTWGGYASDASNVSVSTFTASDIGSKETESAGTANDTTASPADTTVAPETTVNPETTAAPDTTSAPDTNISERMQYINAYWEMCRETYAKELNGFAVVEEGKKTTLDTFEAKQYVYTAKYEGVEYKMQMTVTYSGGLMFIVTYTAKAENYDSHLAEVEKILSEFDFK